MQHKPIQYDIDSILSSDDFITGIHNALYQSYEAHDPNLFEVECNIYAIAAFYVDCGGGFESIVDNENYEIILDAIKAKDVVEGTLLYRALCEFEGLLDGYGVPHNPEGWFEHDAVMEATGKFEEFRASITDLERRYFYEKPSLWGDANVYIDATKDYAREHRAILLKRRGEQTASSNH